MNRRDLCAALATSMAMPALARVASAASSADRFAFSYFQNADNGGAGMRLAISDDGWRFRPVRGGLPMLVPTVGENKLMRDPSIARDPLTGLYHMVWTTGWTGVTIGHASSRDLVHWSAQQAVPVMAAFPGTKNSWAPELTWNDAARCFLIVWASTVGAVGYNDHRLYATTTRDFRSFTPTTKFFDPGFSVIDATFLSRNGRTIMFVKDERTKPLRKVIQWCEAILSPIPRFGPLSEPITPAWSEGPTAIEVDGEMRMFFDRYRDKQWGAVASRDGQAWRDVSDRIQIPAGANHGTMIPVGRSLFGKLAALT